MKRVTISTDGACEPNPGPGGWAALLRYENTERSIFGRDPDTTNNRMELMGAIAGLAQLNQPCLVTLRTDSRYVMDGITTWMHNWRRRGWRTSSGKPVLNRDLWLALDAATQPHEITWEWVRGHSGDPDNERVDRLASECLSGVTEPSDPNPRLIRLLADALATHRGMESARKPMF